MQYKYLAEWIKENREQNLVFKSIRKFEDQYSIEFSKRKEELHIYLSSQDCFCFFTQSKTIPFELRNELDIINTHLKKARLNELIISETDRIIFVNFSKIDIYNNKQNYKLILELIPRYQNIILLKVEEDNEQIIDCTKKVSFAENRQRQILPGLDYTPPQTDFKIEKKDVSFPISIDSITNLNEFSKKTPNYNSMNLLFEELYFNWIFKTRNERIKNDKIKRINKEIKKKNKKIEKQKKELITANKEEKWKQQAELLKANFASIKKGMKSIVLQNYYEDNFPEIEIMLNPKKDAKQNIEHYFKKYRKARDGKVIIQKQIEIAQNEIEVLERDIFELEETEIFFSKQEKTKKKKPQKTGYKKITIDENWEIYIGRTSKENDMLTTRFAKPHDWWFHTRIFRGTHVILRNYNKKELPNKLKLLCSQLAAYYSKAKKSTNVPVDYTQIRYVRKPRGSAPGYVIYKEQKTLFVDPLSIRAVAEKLEK
ncbi:MAG: NFACT RNA binding domain-containing protein [Candidatus Cloacimonadota bacterium]|nr:NFACT RNA binding domain-containing protein [Candidatus Cloacimonadota bacterium]